MWASPEVEDCMTQRSEVAAEWILDLSSGYDRQGNHSLTVFIQINLFERMYSKAARRMDFALKKNPLMSNYSN
jgi:hypothetical protein